MNLNLFAPPQPIQMFAPIPIFNQNQLNQLQQAGINALQIQQLHQHIINPQQHPMPVGVMPLLEQAGINLNQFAPPQPIQLNQNEINHLQALGVQQHHIEDIMDLPPIQVNPYVNQVLQIHQIGGHYPESSASINTSVNSGGSSISSAGLEVGMNSRPNSARSVSSRYSSV
jgi:hypothetical protein